MKYLLLIYMSETAMTPTEREHCIADSTKLTWDLKEKGQYIHASPLQPISTATTVRIREASVWSPTAPSPKPASSSAATT